MRNANRKIFASIRKSGSRNMMVTSDIRLEVEIRPFRACAMKNTQYNPHLWPNHQNFHVFRKSGSRNTIITSDFRLELEIRPFHACAMKNTQCNPYLWPNSPKFPHLSGNQGRRTPSGVRDINLPEAIQFCSQDALRMHYRQITYEVTLTSYDHYTISSVIVDLAMGQIPRSTERSNYYFSMFGHYLSLQLKGRKLRKRICMNVLCIHSYYRGDYHD